MSGDYILISHVLGGLFLGLLVGFVCFGGLWWGFQLLVRGQESEDSGYRRGLFLKGALILGGQLLVALGLLVLIPLFKLNPIALAGGVVISIFAMGFFTQKRVQKP